MAINKPICRTAKEPKKRKNAQRLGAAIRVHLLIGTIAMRGQTLQVVLQNFIFWIGWVGLSYAGKYGENGESSF
jgi:hypothetical protein